MINKIALVVGHSKKRKGCYNETYKIKEYDFNNELVHEIHNKCDNTIMVYRDTLKDLPEKINKLKPVKIISFHCNAFNTKVSGTETLYYCKSTKSKKLAQKFQDVMLKVLKLNNRGLIPVKSGGRGYYVLKKTNAPCIIIEPFFLDNHLDYEKFQKIRNKYIEEFVILIKSL